MLTPTLTPGAWIFGLTHVVVIAIVLGVLARTRR